MQLEHKNTENIIKMLEKDVKCLLIILIYLKSMIDKIYELKLYL
jgi:hypothetical protein